MIFKLITYLILIIFLKIFESFRMFFKFFVLMITIQCGWCDKVSPKPGLELFREDYKSVKETCLAVGFVKNNCKNDSQTSKTGERLSITFFFTRLHVILVICVYVLMYILLSDRNNNNDIFFKSSLFNFKFFCLCSGTA